MCEADPGEWNLRHVGHPGVTAYMSGFDDEWSVNGDASLSRSGQGSGELNPEDVKMSREKVIMSLLLTGAFLLVPVKLTSDRAHDLPRIGISNACGAGVGCCDDQIGSLCTMGDEVLINHARKSTGCPPQ